jgi:hypothetical protein
MASSGEKGRKRRPMGEWVEKKAKKKTLKV